MGKLSTNRHRRSAGAGAGRAGHGHGNSHAPPSCLGLLPECLARLGVPVVWDLVLVAPLLLPRMGKASTRLGWPSSWSVRRGAASRSARPVDGRASTATRPGTSLLRLPPAGHGPDWRGRLPEGLDDLRPDGSGVARTASSIERRPAAAKGHAGLHCLWAWLPLWPRHLRPPLWPGRVPALVRRPLAPVAAALAVVPALVGGFVVEYILRGRCVLRRRGDAHLLREVGVRLADQVYLDISTGWIPVPLPVLPHDACVDLLLHDSLFDVIVLQSQVQWDSPARLDGRGVQLLLLNRIHEAQEAVILKGTVRQVQLQRCCLTGQLIQEVRAEVLYGLVVHRGAAEKSHSQHLDTAQGECGK
mmetsp:Transcript_7343/g.16711  ORF Transcript_7343/g.16711 Transcript_7343/m.16711 type:complete len:359 (-) Transcript_7343:267-1343(-)